MPLGRGWELGFTRPGIIFFAALLGIWAAALYSGNNLLHRCGAMLRAITLTALLHCRRLLQAFPDPAPLLPYLEQNSATVVCKSTVFPFAVAAVVDLGWHYDEGGFDLTARCEAGQLRLQGRLKPQRRGVLKCTALQLESAAPLGLFLLRLQRDSRGEVVVLPEPMAWHADGRSDGVISGQQLLSGDEWHDLRVYVPGDALTQVHWRKASGDISDWRVKRFASDAGGAPDALLRVDLRLPAYATEAAFELLLSRVWFWVLEQNSRGRVIFGQRLYDLSDVLLFDALQRAIAAARPETEAAAGEGGLLLAVCDER